jgi:hypothetical protein
MRAKFVYESLSFKRGVDPKGAMGIGLAERWKEENLRKERPEYLHQRGFTPSLIREIDPQYYNARIILDFGMLKWANLPGISEKEIELMDQEFAGNYINLRKEAYFHAGDINEKNLASYTVDELAEKFPFTAKTISEYPLEFISGGLSGKSTFGRDLYQNYFDPFNYPFDELQKFHILGTYGDDKNFETIIEDFPKYYDYFLRNAPDDILLEEAKTNDRLLKSIIDIDRVFDISKDEYRTPGYFLLNAIVRTQKEESQRAEYLAMILSTSIINTPKVPASFIRKAKKPLFKNLSANLLRKYFSDIFPDISEDMPDKMADRPDSVIDAEIRQAEDILTGSGLTTITTSSTQKKNRSIAFEDHHGNNYSIVRSGYLRKQTPRADRMSVIEYNPYSTYPKLAERALKLISKKK